MTVRDLISKEERRALMTAKENMQPAGQPSGGHRDLSEAKPKSPKRKSKRWSRIAPLKAHKRRLEEELCYTQREIQWTIKRLRAIERYHRMMRKRA